MKLTSIGHAGFLLQAADIRLACDPWFYTALYGSWSPKPYNRHLIKFIKPTHIYLTHGHEDHCDLRFLKELDPSTQIIAPDFKDKEMQSILSFWPNTIFLGHKEILALDRNFVIGVLHATDKNDSAALFGINGYTILNLNDCYLEPDVIPKCDMLMSQFSGAIHYPHSYDFPSDVQQSKVKEFKDRAYRDILAKTKNSSCSVFIPSAGPPCFLDPVQEHLNNEDNTIFYPWKHFSEQFTIDNPDCKVVEVEPGHQYWIGQNQMRPIGVNREHISFKDYRDITKNERLESYNTEVITKEDLKQYFDQVRKNHLHILKKEARNFRLNSGGEWIINLSSMVDTVWSKDEAPDWVVVNYTITIPTTIMKDITKGKGWDVPLASGRIKLHRDEDVYDTLLFKILMNDMNPEKTMDTPKSNEMIHKDGLCFQRYCPHAGADLKNASTQDGIITCPRHNWKWDSAGKCISGGNTPLKVDNQ